MNRLTLLLSLAALCLTAHAEDPPQRHGFAYPPSMDGARVEIYKEINGTALKLWIFPPAEPSAFGLKRPAIVFFFGGGWANGSPSQFESQCRHFASRGMVAITADYRVSSRQQVKATA
jgi:acetyl esterase